MKHTPSPTDRSADRSYWLELVIVVSVLVYHLAVLAGWRDWQSAYTTIVPSFGFALIWLVIGGIVVFCWDAIAALAQSTLLPSSKVRVVIVGVCLLLLIYGFARVLMVPLPPYHEQMFADTHLSPLWIVLGFQLPLASFIGTCLLARSPFSKKLSWLEFQITTTGLGLVVLGTLTAVAFRPITLLWQIVCASHTWLALPLLGWVAVQQHNKQPHPQQLWERCAQRGGLGWVLAASVCAGLAVSLALCLVPPAESDELRYHLPPLEVYLTAGRMIPITHNAFTNFPFLTEMLFVVPMTMGSDRGAKVVHWVFLLLTTGLVWSWVRYSSRMSPMAHIPASLAACACVCIPTALVIASWAFVELAWTFWVVWGIWMVWRSSSDRHWWWIVLAGVTAGAALATKHTGLAGAAVIIVGVVLNFSGPSTPTRRLGVALLFCVLVVAPWWVRAGLFTGNPVFPLLYQWFPTHGWNDYTQVYFEFHSQLKGGLNQFWLVGWLARGADLVVLPLRQWLYPFSFGANPLGGLWGALLLGTAFGVCGAIRTKNYRTIYLASALMGMWGFWALTYRDNRFVLPVVVLAIVVSGLVVAIRMRSSRQHPTLVLGGAVVYALMITMAQLHPVWRNAQPVVIGTMDRASYLAQILDYYPVVQAIGAETKPGKVLVVGFERGYYYPHAVISDFFDIPYEIELALTATSAPSINNALLAAGITHVALHHAHLYNQPGNDWRYLLHFLPPNEAVSHLKNIATGTGWSAYHQALEAVQRTEAWQRYDHWLNDPALLEPIHEYQGITLFRVRAQDVVSEQPGLFEPVGDSSF